MLLILVGVAFMFLAVTVHERKIRILVASLRHRRLLKPIQITTLYLLPLQFGNLPLTSREHHTHGKSCFYAFTFELYHLILDENHVVIDVNSVIMLSS